MSGCIVLLVDESSAMDSKVAAPAADAGMSLAAGATPKSKAESVATAVNSLLNKLSRDADAEIAIVGYRTNESGAADVGPRWSGPLAGRDFVRTGELRTAPLTIEHRTRRVPTGTGTTEETVEFPVWYQPALGDKAPQIAAFEYCKQLLDTRKDDGQSLMVHISAAASADGNPTAVIRSIQESQPADRAPLVFHAHLGTSSDVPPTLYPANRAYLSAGPVRDLFERSSPMPEMFAKVLREQNIKVVPNARGLIYNAGMIDLSRLMRLIHTHVQSQTSQLADLAPPVAETVSTAPPSNSEVEPITSLPVPDTTVAGEAEDKLAVGVDDPAAGSVSRECPALVVFVLDRSLDDPYTAESDNSFIRLRDQLIDLTGQVTRVGDGCVDIAIVSYGGDITGDVEVRSTLEGGLQGRSFARDDELLTGAVRDESYEEERSNGVGGILKIPHVRPVLVELEPTLAAPPTKAFEEAARLIGAWRSEHASITMPVIALHLTRGKGFANETAAAVRQLQDSADAGAVVVYHLIATDDGHAAVSYPSSEHGIQGAELQNLWRLSSPLLARDQIADENPSITPESRGLVINGRFNLLYDAIKRAKD